MMRSEKLRTVLEDVDDLGLLVLTDGRCSFRVRNSDMTNLAFYIVDDDEYFSWGWVEMPGSGGRVDCLDWATFYREIRARARKPRAYK